MQNVKRLFRYAAARYDRICGMYEPLPCSAGRPVVTTVHLLFLFLMLSNKKNMKEEGMRRKKERGMKLRSMTQKSTGDKSNSQMLVWAD